MSFVPNVEADQKRRDRLDRARVRERATVNVTAAWNRFDQWAHPLFRILVVAANDDVALDFVREVCQGRRADVVKSRDDFHAFRRKLPALFGCRSRPHAERARRFASDGWFERNGDVNQQRAGLKLVTNVLHGGDLRRERDRQHDYRRVGGRLGIRRAVNRDVARSESHQRGAHLRRGLLGAPRVARSNNDFTTFTRPSQREPFALIARPADNSYLLIRHGQDCSIPPRHKLFNDYPDSEGVVISRTRRRYGEEASERIEKTEFKSALIKGCHRLREWVAQQFASRKEKERVEWRALARSFLKLGLTGFGGGFTVIAQIRRFVVHRRRWMSEEEFLDAVSLAQSLPGANAANAITYVGLKLGGMRGALVSVVSFIIPSFLLMIGLTIAHNHLIQFTDAQRVFQGFNAAVVGLIAATTVRLGQTAMQQQWHLELGVAVGFMLIFTQTTVAEVVMLAGITGILIRSYKARARHHVRQRILKGRQASVRSVAAEQKARQHAAEMIENPDDLTDDYKVEVSLPDKAPADKPPVEPSAGGDEEVDPKEPEEKSEREVKSGDENKSAGEEMPFVPVAGKKGVTSKLRSVAPVFLILLFTWPVVEKLVTVWHLMTIFLRVGSITFGGGYVMIPQIETDIVEVYRWMDHQTFADGMAFGQITPGPVLITATFIGYKVAGIAGAIATTIAAFLPSFVMTVIAGTSINRFRTNFHVQAFLAGVAPAVVGMLAAAGVTLAKSGLSGATGFGIATLSCLLMLRAKLNPVVIILGCGLLQWAISRGLIGWMPA